MIATSSIAVVGTGGLGSVAIEILARLGVGRLVCVDDDVVDWSNLSRLVGAKLEDAKRNRSKVDTLCKHVREINPDVEIEGIRGSVLSPEACMRLKDVDYLVGATDTVSSRMVLNRLSVQYLIPYVDLGFGMGTGDDGELIYAAGKVMSVIPGEWCLQCKPDVDHRQAADEVMSEFDRRRQIERGYISGVNIPNPSVVFLDMAVASFGMTELFNMIVNFKAPSKYIYYNALTTSIHSLTPKRREDCVVCSPEGFLGLGDLAPFEDIRDTGPLPCVPGMGKDKDGEANTQQ